MLIFTTWVAVASAAEVTCDEVAAMLDMGLPASAVVEGLKGDQMTPDEQACLRETADLPAEVVEWLDDPAHGVKLEDLLESAAATNAGAAPTSAEPVRREALNLYPTPPPPPPDQVSLMMSGECGMPFITTQLPEPAAAVALSGFIGFGAGHFYSGNRKAGAGLLLGQAAGIGVTALSAETPNPTAALIAGGTVFGLARLIDVAAAPASAKGARRNHLDSCGYL